ncbi:hypothetical protein IT575_12365 [bacterium]|nr:hypothetical protein [bacterium]
MTAFISRWGIALAAVFLGVCMMAAPASAAWDTGGLSDEQFVSDYFGTTLLMVTSAPVVDVNVGYWTDKLPQEFINTPDYLVGVINAQRLSKNQTLLDALTYPIALGWETPLENGSFQYHIDFNGCRPSEVEAVVKLLGGEGKILPGAKFSVKPLSYGYFYGYATGGSNVTFAMGSQQVTVNVAQSIDAVRKQIGDILKARFGKEVNFSMSISQDYNYDNVGTVNANVSLNVNLDGPVGGGEGGL